MLGHAVTTVAGCRPPRCRTCAVASAISSSAEIPLCAVSGLFRTCRLSCCNLTNTPRLSVRSLRAVISSVDSPRAREHANENSQTNRRSRRPAHRAGELARHGTDCGGAAGHVRRRRIDQFGRRAAAPTELDEIRRQPPAAVLLPLALPFPGIVRRLRICQTSRVHFRNSADRFESVHLRPADRLSKWPATRWLAVATRWERSSDRAVPV
jgi:hypothetical protein